MPRGSSAKHERRYEHIKESDEQRGMSESCAKEMASRTVNKERARSGESKTASRSSTRPMPPLPCFVAAVPAVRGPGVWRVRCGEAGQR
ncbi:hypothetical protein BCL76_11023 [Streptomyces sp. CG 926]|uniref:hypothetical protein n=1 Tax=Streptomyces sp. CG 926 TaxID=1882405 RepID=UPI000D799296|nr:hypothetical protein [Streptomyces sp. CG 926]PWK66537.1 hypothetical protein BCL76_11023 [Streptomyces sp. CG 926]